MTSTGKNLSILYYYVLSLPLHGIDMRVIYMSKFLINPLTTKAPHRSRGLRCTNAQSKLVFTKTKITPMTAVNSSIMTAACRSPQ
jgi:hypothetical protein